LTNQFIGTSIRYASTRIDGHQVTMVTEFCMVVPHVRETVVLNVPRQHSVAYNSVVATGFFENMYIPHTLTTPK
jgi:nitroimidazol reductase NimA-like FMN-containing flavoprotein (pyridoxamine 5'-phosphate oxidase superfamily)